MNRLFVTYRCHEVVVVPFPFVERDIVQARPAVILSSDAFIAEHDQVILAMVTTAKRSSWPSDIVIQDLPSAGLKIPSVLRWKVFTRLQTALGPRIGVLGKQDRATVLAQQKLILG